MLGLLEGVAVGTLAVIITMKECGVKQIALRAPLKAWGCAFLLALPLFLAK